jgi:hypothetical protein
MGRSKAVSNAWFNRSIALLLRVPRRRKSRDWKSTRIWSAIAMDLLLKPPSGRDKSTETVKGPPVRQPWDFREKGNVAIRQNLKQSD